MTVWAENGECEKNPGYMLVNCKLSCDRENKKKGGQDLNKEVAHIGSFYELSANDIDGERLHFRNLQEKVVVIVNVASYCGYTESHYKGLVDLYDSFKGSNDFEILAFPSNEFGEQEPEECPMIKKFAKKKGVNFRMMYKINVNDENAHIVYKYLKAKAGPSHISWNFSTYYVVSPSGEIRSYSGVEPMDLQELVEGLIRQEL